MHSVQHRIQHVGIMLDMSCGIPYNLGMNQRELMKVIDGMGTREQVARKLGVSLRTVYRWINGQSRPSKLAMANILQIVGEE